MRKKPDSCEQCGNSGELKKCSVCRQAWYCSRDCQVAAWKTHKDDCKLWQQQRQEEAAAAAAAASSSSTQPGSSSAAVEAAAAGTSSSKQPGSSSAAAAAGASNSQQRAGNQQPNSSSSRTRKQSTTSSSSGNDDDNFQLPFRYKTNADPTKKDIESPLYFSKEELAMLTEVYPGLMYDGGRCSVNLDRYLMKKVKTWYVQYLFRRQMTPPPGSREDNVPFFQALVNKEVAITSATYCEQMGLGSAPIRRNGTDHGVAGCMSIMMEHGRKGIAKHPKGMPKIMIYEPDVYSDVKLSRDM